MGGETNGHEGAPLRSHASPAYSVRLCAVRASSNCSKGLLPSSRNGRGRTYFPRTCTARVAVPKASITRGLKVAGSVLRAKDWHVGFDRGGAWAGIINQVRIYDAESFTITYEVSAELKPVDEDPLLGGLGMSSCGRFTSNLWVRSSASPKPRLLRGSARHSSTVSEIGLYALEVAAYSDGRDSIALEYVGYRPCHNAAEAIAGRSMMRR